MCKRNAFLLALMLGLFVSCDYNSNIFDITLYRIRVGEKYGFMNDQGQIVIEPQFDEAGLVFSEEFTLVKKGDKKGLIDKTGAFVLELDESVDYYGIYTDGLFHVRYGKLGLLGGRSQQGVMNMTGQIVAENATIKKSGNSTFIVIDIENNGRKFIVANKDGEPISDSYDEIGYFSNGLCAVSSNNKWGYLNTEGKLVIDTIYDFAFEFSDDEVAKVVKGDYYYFIDKSGKELFSIKNNVYRYRSSHRNVRMVCERNIIKSSEGKFLLVDKSGKNICSIDADVVSDFDAKSKMAILTKGGKSSLIDVNGNIVLETEYELVGLSDGIATIAIYGDDFKKVRCGYMDTKGKILVKPVLGFFPHAIYSNLLILKGGEGELSYYDKQGNFLWKDIMGSKNEKKSLPYSCIREDYIEYFDSRISELDPIEGIYYLTYKDFYQDRDNLNNVGQNNTKSRFCAIAYDNTLNGFSVDFLDDSKMSWVNKFVKIGNSNSYAIQKIDQGNDYSKDGRVTINDFNQFEFKLDQGHNDYYNFFVTYEFVRDYPAVADMEMVQRAEWTGSGFAIADGYIVTNYHVTNGAKTIRIKGVNGDMEEAYKGFVVASDKEHDLSIVKIVDKDFEGFDAIPYKIGKTTVDVGDDIFVLGYPMTQTMGEEVKLTNGVISAASGYKGDASMYQISAAVQSGNSGGPLFNEDGAVIGVVCAKHAGAENANYAVKVSYLYSLITSSNLGIDISGNDKVKGKSLSKQVKKIKDFVYLIECSSK